MQKRQITGKVNLKIKKMPKTENECDSLPLLRRPVSILNQQKPVNQCLVCDGV